MNSYQTECFNRLGFVGGPPKDEGCFLAICKVSPLQDFGHQKDTLRNPSIGEVVLEKSGVFGDCLSFWRDDGWIGWKIESVLMHHPSVANVKFPRTFKSWADCLSEKQEKPLSDYERACLFSMVETMQTEPK